MNIEMNYCRRCGCKLTNISEHAYKCETGHLLFYNSAPAVCAILTNDKNEALVVVRAIDPGKGELDAPGGFCDGGEKLEDAVARELKEEIGLEPNDYSTPVYLLSGVDSYSYKGETLPVLSVVFTAKIDKDAKITAADDVASAKFVPIKDINLDDIYFDVVRAGYARLQNTT
jgi:ADP-ribose pyrophosphatase YjhB (NUDIX family)